MKNLLFATVALTCCMTAVAQTNYYAGRDTVAGTNVTYLVDHSSTGTYHIANITNIRDFRQPLKLLNGNPAPLPFEQYDAARIGDHAAIARQILEEVFTLSELSALIAQDEDFATEYIILPNGNIAEIRFAFPRHPLLYSIPPDKWFSIEQKIKQRMKYNVSAKGKTVQYIVAFNIWGIKGMLK